MEDCIVFSNQQGERIGLDLIMKVLIVAEQLDIQDYLRQLNPDPSISFFQYTHPLKAMDNLEEINPTLILWNVDDFPRHWKSFLPYCHTLFSSAMPQFHLISETILPDEETGKADTLKVDGIHCQGFFHDDMAQLLAVNESQILHETKIRSTPPIPAGSGLIQLQHPNLHCIVIGDVVAADQKTILVKFQGEKIIASFLRNLIIEYAFMQIKETRVTVMLRVAQNHPDGTTEFLILNFL